ELVHEPLLLLRQGFTSREWFDAACRAVHAHPRGLLESGAPSLLVALAREGLGIAVVPATVRVARVRVRPVPILPAGPSIGHWVAANWDPRRFIAPYAERFVDALAAYTERHVGQEFRQAPPIPLPPAARE